MSEVILHINGRDYRVRAKDGEEEKLVRAGHLVEQRCEQARAALGTLSDTSLYFYAALMLADDLVGDDPPAPPPVDDSLRLRAAGIADRLEAIAAALEGED